MPQFKVTGNREKNLKNAGILDKRCNAPRVRNWASEANVIYDEETNTINVDGRTNAGKYVKEEINRRTRERNNYEEKTSEKMSNEQDIYEEYLYEQEKRQEEEERRRQEKEGLEEEMISEEEKDWMENYETYMGLTDDPDWEDSNDPDW